MTIYATRRKNGRIYKEGDWIGRFELLHRLADVSTRAAAKKDRRWHVRCRKCGTFRDTTTHELFNAPTECRCHSTTRSDWHKLIPQLIKTHTIKQIAKRVHRSEHTVRAVVNKWKKKKATSQ